MKVAICWEDRKPGWISARGDWVQTFACICQKEAKATPPPPPPPLISTDSSPGVFSGSQVWQNDEENWGLTEHSIAA